MSVSIQNPIATFNNSLAKKSKFLMVRAFAAQQSKNVVKAEEKVKAITKEFISAIHSGSKSGIDIRI